MLLNVTYVAEYKGNSLLLFHDNGDYTSVSQCYITCIWPILFMLTFGHRASSIWNGHFTTLQRMLFVHLINKYI